MSKYAAVEMDEIPNTTSLCRGATLTWRHVNVYAKDKKNGNRNKKFIRIINDASGFIQPGTLCAVMGSRFENRIFKWPTVKNDKFNKLFNIFFSGAGKSTLMSALAFLNMGVCE